MEQNYSIPKTNEPYGLKGWLILIGVRLVIGLVVGLSNIFMLSNSPSGFYYYYGSVILIYVSVIVEALTVILYFTKKRAFIYFYIATVGIILAANIVSLNAPMVGGQIVIESLMIGYLLMSRRVANTFDFHTKMNSPADRMKEEPLPQICSCLTPEKEKAFDEIRAAARLYAQKDLTDEEFKAVKDKLLAQL